MTRSLLRLALAAALLALITLAARAELTVSGATGVNGVNVGAKFPNDHFFDLPANAELRLLKSPEGTTFVMRGPYTGTLADFVTKCTGLLARFRGYCRADSDGDRLPVGGTRGPRD